MPGTNWWGSSWSTLWGQSWTYDLQAVGIQPAYGQPFITGKATLTPNLSFKAVITPALSFSAAIEEDQ